jgi:Tfp pilus assembly PilM family ATPase
VWGLLDLGHRTARLVLFLGEIPVLARSFDAGGADWTKRIAEWFGISEESAAVHKHDYGVADPTTADVPQPAGDLGGMMRGALRPQLQNVTMQIERSYAYVLQCYAKSSAGELVLAGGGSALKGLAEYLADKLGIPVRRGEDLLGEAGSRLRDGRPESERRVPLGELAGAIGLAIGTETPR